MKRKFYFILLIVSIFLSACSDALFEDMDNAINNPQNPGGDLYNSTITTTPLHVPAGSVVLDGIRESIYGEELGNVAFDPCGDGAGIYTGTDVANIAFVEDGTSLWVYTTFCDPPIDPLYGQSTSMARAYLINFNHSEMNGYTAVMIYHDGAQWLSNSFSYVDPLTDFLTDHSIFVSNNGIETQIRLDYIKAASNSFNFQFNMGDDYAIQLQNDRLEFTLQIQ
jgi:hypothetical protein